MIQTIALLLKGIAIGITDVIPGVSGATTAMVLGVYDKIIAHASQSIHAIKAKDRHAFLSHLRFLIPVLLGVGMGLVLFAKIIKVLLLHWPSHTQIVFTGLIIGAIPSIVRQGEFFPVNRKKTISFSLGALLMITILVWDFYTGAKTSVLSAELPIITVGYVLQLFAVGFIASIAIALPGISGSLILLLMGQYSQILSLMNFWIDHLLQGEMAWAPLIALSAFAFGILIGLFFYAVLVAKIMHRHKDVLFSFALGLILFSVIKIWPNTSLSLSHLLLLAGAITLPLLSTNLKKKAKRIN